MKQVIAYSDSVLTKDGNDPSLGNFACRTVEDYVRTNRNEIAGKHIVVLNRGGLRNNIPMGEITKGHIFELMPFDNEIVVLKITGEKLMDCIRSMIKDKKLISRNLSFTVKDNEASDIKIWGFPFNIKEDYYIVTTDYLAMGGDNCSFFGKPVLYETTKLKLRDAMINYCLMLTKINKHIIPERTIEIRISK
jgi:2',3'-cyclic-nucleotide 2'-phosphodiesterase (5'-nucleotidase family)